MSGLKARILERVSDDLVAIEAALRENLDPRVELVERVAGHTLFAGGKRLRPLLMVLAARLCGFDGERTIRFSTLFEYLHVATLIHDDVVDGARIRRGLEAAHHRWSSPVAVLTGDFLLARSLTLAAETGDPEVIRVIAGITEEMSQGEIQQLERKGDLDLTEAEYLEIIRRKTAVLLRGACRAGGLVAGADAAAVDALSDYGHHLGMAFQMADDLLDYTADTASLGKAAGADLREGKLTLPVIRTLSVAASEDRARLADALGSSEFSEADFAELRDLLERYGGIGYTREQARDHVAVARARLSGFPDSETRALLMDIADYALERKT
jgi:octaprenyl-diphosphate synthase